jgi:hypothetical protein
VASDNIFTDMKLNEDGLHALPRYLGKGPRGRRWLAAFAARQEQERRWVSFAEIADWCGRASGNILPDAALRGATFAALAGSLGAGEFERRGHSAVLLLCPGLAPGGVGRRWMAGVAALGDGADIAEHYLALCWLPLDRAWAWLRRRRIAPPPAWSAARAADIRAPAAGGLERCAAWLRQRQASGLKREALWQEARAALPGLSTRDFDGAYRVIFRRKRGRPRKSAI